VAWSPWLVLATIRVVRRPSRWHVIAAALVFAALLLSGHPEIAVAECLVAAGLGMVAWRRRAGALLPLSAAALAATLGASLAACQLLPFLLVAPHSLRASHGAGMAATTAVAVPGSSPFFPPGQARLFLGVLSPWAFGRPFHEPFTGPGNWPIAAGSYLGLVALAGMAAALGSRRRRLVLALGGLALALLLLAARFLPCRWLLGVLPLGGALAVDRFLPAAALPLALLAALGLDELVRRRRSAAASWALMLAAATASLWVRHDVALLGLWLLVVLGLLLARLSDRSYTPSTAPPVAAPAAPPVAAPAAPPVAAPASAPAAAPPVARRGAPGWAQGRRRACGLGLVVLASLLDLGSWGRDALPRGHRELFYPRTPLVTAIAGTVEGGPWRAVGGGFAVYPSLLPMYGIADVRIDNPLALAEQLRPLGEIFDFRPEGRRYKSGFRHLDHPFLDFLNVRAVILAAPAAVPGKLEPVNAGASPRVFRNPAALPRFFLPVGVELHGRDDALAGLQELRDARRVVLLREEVAGWRAPERPWDPAAVRILRAHRGAVSLLLPADGEKLLATSLPFPAGWTAAAEGRALPLRRVLVNTAYLGVVVPAGVARVDLSFVPPGFRLGAVLSVLGALAVSSLAALGRPQPGPFGVAREKNQVRTVYTH